MKIKRKTFENMLLIFASAFAFVGAVFMVYLFEYFRTLWGF